MVSASDASLSRLLGLARRAGAVTLGTHATTRGLAHRRIGLILLASDASSRTALKIRRAAGTIPVVVRGSMDSMGDDVGSAPVAVVGLHHGPFADRMLRMLNEGGDR